MTAEQGALVVCKSIERCLKVFPKSLWPQVDAMLAELPEDGRSAAVKRLFVGSASEVVIDAGSRILIAPELREWAGLQKEVVFTGLGNYFELWDKASLARQEELLFEGQEMKPGIPGLSFGRLQRVA